MLCLLTYHVIIDEVIKLTKLKAVELLLKKFKERFGKYPNAVQFDEGKEFYNVGVRDLPKRSDV